MNRFPFVFFVFWKEFFGMARKKKQSKAKQFAPPPPPPRLDLDAPQEEFAEQLDQMSDHLEQLRVWGHAGGGLVKIEMDGMMRVLRCQLAPELLEKKDRELIEDLVVSAVNDAASKARQQMFTILPSLLGTDTDTDDPEEEPDLIAMAKALSQDKDFKNFMAQMGDPLISSFVEMLAALEEAEDEDGPPRRGR
jgi:DNA-binding YbaB/EbfC family protein